MATLQASFCRTHRETIRATINMPNPRIITSSVCLPKLPTKNFLEELDMRSSGYRISTARQMEKEKDTISDPVVMAKLYAIMEAIADRVEMHKNIGEQRNNWNSLLLTSINAITLTAATMSGTAASIAAGAPILPLKLSATMLYAAAAGMLVVMNKIQPSQLAEEQRNAARLFKQLHSQIQTKLSINGSVPNMVDVKEAMEKVLALDKAYPLPLLGRMLDKFPTSVKPAVWWPQQHKRRRQVENFGGKKMDGNNGWNGNLEAEMEEIVGVLKRKDMDEYLRLSKTALKVNKILAISGPLLTGFAALGSACLGGGDHGTWAAVVAVVAGALASVVNTVEHGGQVGMVFEMYRSNAGFFKLMEESIESNLNETDVERRDNGEVFKMKLALQLGRSLSQLEHLAASSSSRNGKAADHEEFASKLF